MVESANGAIRTASFESQVKEETPALAVLTGDRLKSDFGQNHPKKSLPGGSHREGFLTRYFPGIVSVLAICQSSRSDACCLLRLHFTCSALLEDSSR